MRDAQRAASHDKLTGLVNRAVLGVLLDLEWKGQDADAAEVLREADAYLLQAKRRGRNGVAAATA